MSPLDNEGGEVHKNGYSHCKKLQGCAKRYLLLKKGACVLKAVEKRPPACTERLKAGEKASR